jgi:hypothetical protein
VALNGFSQERLTFASMIGVSSIEIVDSLRLRIMDQLNRFFFVNEFVGVKSIRRTLAAIFDGEAHTSKPKD